MDIQLASNFERYLYYLMDEDTAKVRKAMADFSSTGGLTFESNLQKRVAQDFLSGSATRSETIATIRDFYQATGYVLDPHTAIGVKVGKEQTGGECPLICLATAHPAKFGDAVQEAINTPPTMPESLSDIENRPSRCEIIDAETEAVRNFVEQHSC
jgi:threonine synthase